MYSEHDAGHIFIFLRESFLFDHGTKVGDVRKRIPIDVYFCQGCLEYRKVARKEDAIEAPEPRGNYW